MKKLSIIILLFIVVTSCKGGEKDKLKRYEIKSAIVHYTSTTSGKVMGSTISGSGTESLSFKDWGAVELIEEKSTQTTEVKIFGRKKIKSSETHTMNKLDNGETYLVDFERKTITLSRDATMDFMLETNTDAGDTGKSMLESMGGEKIGEEKFLTYDCEIWEVMGVKQWIYKGVSLKSEATVLGIKTLKEAVSVEFNISVPDKNFKLPDFPIEEVEGYMTNEENAEEMEDMDEHMEELSKMSYKEWKAKFVPLEEDLMQMSEDELKETYEMIQKMIKRRKEL